MKYFRTKEAYEQYERDIVLNYRKSHGLSIDGVFDYMLGGDTIEQERELNRLLIEQLAADGYDKNHLYTKVAELRWSRNLTQSKLAELSGINIRQIQKLEAGEINPENMTLSNALRLANALNLSNPVDLLEESDASEMP
jgi:DNA-binding XRE family transcriptional regulator